MKHKKMNKSAGKAYLDEDFVGKQFKKGSTAP